MGEKCERKGTTQENTIIAVSSTITVFVVMLIITITTVVCLKKKYSKGEGKEKVESLTLEEVSIFPFVIKMMYLFIKSKQSNSVRSRLEDVNQ